MELEWLLILTVSIVVALAIARKQMKGWGRAPPGPRGLPVLGHLHLLSRLPHQDLFKLSQVYGPLMGMRLGSVPLIVASSPEMAKQILHTHDVIFAGRPQSIVRSYTANGFRDIAFSNPSPYWRHMRQLCVTDLFNNKRLLYFGSSRSQEVGALIQSILKDSVPSCAQISSSSPCLVRPKLHTTTNNIISRMVLGKIYMQLENTIVDQNKIMHLFSEVIHLGSQFNYGDYIPFVKWADFQGLVKKSKALAKELYSALQEIIEQRRHDRSNLSNYSQKDFLDILMDAASSSNGELTDEHVKAILMDMFLAGTDTSSSVIEWALADLLLNPQKMETLQIELDKVVGKERMVQELDIMNLPYLDACIKETMRLHPPAPLLLPHKSLTPCEIDGFKIPTQSLVYVNVWAIGRDPHVWDNPLEFRPERFLGTTINYMQANSFQLLPFGSGRRACPGWRLGLINVQIILASLVQGFDWVATKDLDMLESFNMALTKATPLVAFAIPRLSSHVYGV